MKYRKKPVVIDAMRFEATNGPEVLKWVRGSGGDARYGTGRFFINTLEGLMTAEQGDWIIKGVKGEFYPCKPDIFEATYDLVDEDMEHMRAVVYGNQLP